MTDEVTYRKILARKSEILNFLYYKLIDTENESWTTTEQCTRVQSGDRIPTTELMVYSEAFLFELGSFLDTLMKFICGKSIDERFNFNRTNLNLITNPDDFVQFLIQCYETGIRNNPTYSLKKMKRYRNAVTHATILDITKYLQWHAGDGIPRLEQNFYILPDNPEAEFAAYTYNERIALFGFLKAMTEIFDSIVDKLNSENRYSKYRV